MASYHDLFAMFTILAIVCLVLVLFLQTGPRAASRKEKTPSAISTETLSKTSERR
jgi:hypothetical protein